MKKYSTETIEQATRDYSALVETSKRFIEARRARSLYNVGNIQKLIDAFEAYEAEQARTGKPLTVSGYILASGMPKSTFYEASNGMYDYVIEEYKITHGLSEDTETVIDENGQEITLAPWSEVIEKAYLKIQEQRETACSSTRGNPAGNIFLLKAQNGLQEEASPHTVNQNLIIADADKAKTMLEMLR